MTRQVIIAIMFSGLLGACDQKEAAKEPNKALEMLNAETALMSDPDRAGQELEKRLEQRVRVDSGLVLVEADFLNLYALPISTPWTLQCSNGMIVVFGNSVKHEVSRGDRSEDFEVDTSNEVLVTLTIGNIERKNCDVLATRIGKRLLAILGQDQRARQ